MATAGRAFDHDDPEASDLMAGPAPPPPSAEPPVATQSGSVSVTPQYAAIGQGGSLKLQAAGGGGVSVDWLVNGVAGGNATAGMVDANGNYNAPAQFAQSENVVVTAALSGSSKTNYATAVVSLIRLRT